MKPALLVEWWKFRRSPVALVTTALLAVLLPAIGIGFYSAAQSNAVGPLAAKMSGMLIGEGWDAYLGVIAQVAAAGIFVAAGVVVTWAFAREHVDRTFPSLFALTVSRGSIATAKFLILSGWVALLSVIVPALSMAAGAIASVGPLDSAILTPLARLAFVSATTGMLALTVGYAASVGRGYLPAIGVIVLLVAIAQISVLLGAGGWFPFAVPGLVAITGSEAAPTLSAGQFAMVPALIVLAVWLTVTWWRKAQVV